MIQYSVAIPNPSTHLVHISLTIAKPDPQGQQLRMPSWIPGSYLIRDFARQVVQIKVSDGFRIQKTSSDTWQLEVIDQSKTAGPANIEYEVYAWDRSVRGAHVDTTHAFMNLACLCLSVVGQENKPHAIKLTLPAGGKDSWTLATTLESTAIDAKGFGWYSAPNYDELIDHPIEIGDIERIGFIVNHIPHEIVISGRHYGDSNRLKQDVQKICQTHHDLFKSHPPFEKYCFLLTLVGEGYGGLEHRSSAALMSTRASMVSTHTDYKTLLGLFSHEYFHAWNIKGMKPAIFCPYDLTQPQYTRQLWAFEGITSYYDDLALVRSGTISQETYLQILSDNITKLKATPGQAKQTLTESSFDAWTKFYKPDENTPNSGVSYYLKGMMAAFCFDMALRMATEDAVSLDKVMQDLWENYRIDQHRIEHGIPEGAIEKILMDSAKHSELMGNIIYQALYTTEPLVLEPFLEQIGLKLNFYKGSDVKLLENNGNHDVSLGIITAPNTPELQIMTVLADSAAMQAGLSAKDVIVAIDNIKINNQQALDAMLMNYKPNDTILVHAFREDQLMCFQVQLLPALANKANVLIDTSAMQKQIDRRNKWLGLEQ